MEQRKKSGKTKKIRKNLDILPSTHWICCYFRIVVHSRSFHPHYIMTKIINTAIDGNVVRPQLVVEIHSLWPYSPELHTNWIKQLDQLSNCILLYNVSSLKCTQVQPGIGLHLSNSSNFSSHECSQLFQVCVGFAAEQTNTYYHTVFCLKLILK